MQLSRNIANEPKNSN